MEILVWGRDDGILRSKGYEYRNRGSLLFQWLIAADRRLQKWNVIESGKKLNLLVYTNDAEKTTWRGFGNCLGIIIQMSP